MDSQAIDANARYLGVPTLLLMENAGRAIADECAQYKKIAVFSGCGGNGGDGLAAARILHARGHKIKAYALAGARTRECQKNFDILSNLDVSITQIRDSTQCENIKKEVSGCDAVVDALLGVGASGVVREPAKSVIGLINSLSCPKISVDVPSGSGDVKVEADTILALHSGKVAGSKIVDIGIPPEAELYCGPGDVYSAMPPRKVSSRKGDFGRVLVLGGSKDYVGTPTLVAKAALKAGADLVFVSAPAYACDHMAFDSNLIVRPLKSRNHFSEDDVDGLLELDFDVLVVGNGMGRHSDTKHGLRELVKKVDAPMVVDADALRLIERKHLKQNMVLTPHKGEFKALFGDVLGDNLQSTVSSLAGKYCATILLKGEVDVLSDGGCMRLNRSGNPAMTVGGTGDVLAGVIAGLIAQNRDLFASACAAAFITGLAGDMAFERLGVSMAATDVIDSIHDAIKFSENVVKDI